MLPTWPPPAPKPSAGALVVLVILLLARPAAAQEALSVGLGWATFSTLGDPPMPGKTRPTLSPDVGAHVQLCYEREVSREVSLRAELAGGLFYGDGYSVAALSDLGAVYRFDVVKYVPYAFAGLGGVATAGAPIDDAIDWVVVLGGGLDVLSSRERSWGLEGRLASFAGDTTVVTLGVRASLRWGFF